MQFSILNKFSLTQIKEELFVRCLWENVGDVIPLFAVYYIKENSIITFNSILNTSNAVLTNSVPWRHLSEFTQNKTFGNCQFNDIRHVFNYLYNICFITTFLPFYIIRKTCPCNVYPLEPHFYIAKLGYAGVYYFSYFCSKT